MKTAFLIPVYKHGGTLKTVISSLEKYGLPVIVVDDGNDEKNRNLIEETCDFFNGSQKLSVILVKNEKNLGKGGAVINGIRHASSLGFTHVFQLDSDGQHDTSYATDFLEQSEKNPEAVIAGCPEYDGTVPKSRLNGRKIANSWIHIVTLSKKIQDAMIGFRIYPVDTFLKIVDNSKLDLRMGFDIEILVKLFWAGCNIISRPVKISYPLDGISNFRMVKDNMRISWVYTKLCARMLLTWPIILSRRAK